MTIILRNGPCQTRFANLVIESVGRGSCPLGCCLQACKDVEIQRLFYEGGACPYLLLTAVSMTSEGVLVLDPTIVLPILVHYSNDQRGYRNDFRPFLIWGKSDQPFAADLSADRDQHNSIAKRRNLELAPDV